MRTLRALALATVLALAVLLPAGSALASCAMDERSLDQQVADAQVVFVGTVIDLEDQERTALFDVQEVWKGPDIERQVAVHGGPGEPNVATSVDRSWHRGQRHLVMSRIEDGRLVDDSCSPTRPWEDRLADARPADVHRPAASDTDGGTTAAYSPVTWIVVALAGVALAGVALVGGVGYVVTGRGRDPGPPAPSSGPSGGS